MPGAEVRLTAPTMFKGGIFDILERIFSRKVYIQKRKMLGTHHKIFTMILSVEIPSLLWNSWKRYQVFSKASEKFIEKMVELLI